MHGQACWERGHKPKDRTISNTSKLERYPLEPNNKQTTEWNISFQIYIYFLTFFDCCPTLAHPRLEHTLLIVWNGAYGIPWSCSCPSVLRLKRGCNLCMCSCNPWNLISSLFHHPDIAMIASENEESKTETTQNTICKLCKPIYNMIIKLTSLN